jgi:hypothetical protein
MGVTIGPDGNYVPNPRRDRTDKQPPPATTSDQPETLQILGTPYAVQVMYLHEGPCGQTLGLCCSSTRTLTVHSEQSTENTARTLMHEAIHAILAESGWTHAIEEIQEGIVTAIEAGLWQAGFRLVR